MKVFEGKWKISSRDFFKSSCEHCTRIDMAVAAKVQGVIDKVEPFKDNLEEVLYVQQGHEYEAVVFAKLQEELGDGFIELKNATMDETLDLMRQGKKVIAQGFLEAEVGGYAWSGYPDLLIREDLMYDTGGVVAIAPPKDEPKYVVWDVKATSKPKDEYWLQIASYAKVLEEHGFASEKDLGMVLKRFQTLRKPKAESIQKLETATNILLERLSKATPATINESFIENWHCEKANECKKAFCAYPDFCDHALHEEHSLHLVYGANKVDEMRKQGIFTWDDLAASKDPHWAKPANWARVMKTETDSGKPYFELKPKDEWDELPAPTSEDLFFDIEWFTDVLTPEPLVFELGFVDANESFTSLDGFTEADELPNFKKFVEIATAKMKANPNAHIYHWHNPEEIYLKKLVEKHEILHEEVDLILSRLWDLRKTAISRVLPGSNSYSIKKLERYYDADTKLHRKENGITGGDAAMWLFYKATRTEPQLAEQHMQTIRNYNRDDCLSTKLARDWLLSL